MIVFRKFRQNKTLARGKASSDEWLIDKLLGAGIYGGRGYCVSAVVIDEMRSREYPSWQENKEKEIEWLQGNLFDEE
jgi:hypothetical protein